jgi:hypothetical protein
MGEFTIVQITIKHLLKLGSNVNNWTSLESKTEQYNSLWDFVYDKLLFEPYAKPHCIVTLPQPYKWFDTSKFMEAGYSDNLYNELHEITQLWFQTICDGKRMYALDWQHQCYTFDPYLPFETGQLYDKWPIPVFPNGDYYFFLTHDLKNGIFCDGLHFELAIWGEKIINAQKLKAPTILREELV